MTLLNAVPTLVSGKRTTRRTVMTANGLTQFKQMTRATWAAGDFPAIARNDLWAMGERIVRRVGVCPGEDVLDCDRELAPDTSSRFATIDGRIEYYTSVFGPMINLRAFTEAQGTWSALRNDLADLYARSDEDGEYLVVLGHKR